MALINYAVWGILAIPNAPASLRSLFGDGNPPNNLILSHPRHLCNSPVAIKQQRGYTAFEASEAAGWIVSQIGRKVEVNEPAAP